MQIILLEKVVNLGQLGDVVKVKVGYARNFLIPTGKAKRATPANLAEFEGRRAVLEKAHTEAVAAAIAKASKVDGVVLSITQKVALTAACSVRSPVMTSPTRSRRWAMKWTRARFACPTAR